MRHSGIIENNWTPFEPGQQKDKLSFKAKIPKFDNEGSRSPVFDKQINIILSVIKIITKSSIIRFLVTFSCAICVLGKLTDKVDPATYHRWGDAEMIGWCLQWICVHSSLINRNLGISCCPLTTISDQFISSWITQWPNGENSWSYL